MAALLASGRIWMKRWQHRTTTWHRWSSSGEPWERDKDRKCDTKHDTTEGTTEATSMLVDRSYKNHRGFGQHHVDNRSKPVDSRLIVTSQISSDEFRSYAVLFCFPPACIHLIQINTLSATLPGRQFISDDRGSLHNTNKPT